MDKTGIIWTEKTWNPVTGCKQITSGCAYCYAKTIAERMRGQAFPNGFGLTYRPHRLNEPYRWKEPTLAFVNSMSDLFWEEITDEYRDRVLDVIEDNPQHQFQVLTKRHDVMLRYAKRRKLPANFWAGVTIEDAKNYALRIEALRKVDAEIRFISFEPLIGDIGQSLDLSAIQWVITGGESGTHLWHPKLMEQRALVLYDRDVKKWLPKPHAVDWIRRIRDNAIINGTAYFHKQWGGSYPEAAGRVLDGRTWNEMPRYPGDKTEIDNAYLRKLEGATL